jgi:hypothetical protein
MGFPIAQQLPAHHADGRVLVIGFTDNHDAMCIEANGTLLLINYTKLTIEWHLNEETGQFEPDIPEDYPEHEEADEQQEVP